MVASLLGGDVPGPRPVHARPRASSRARVLLAGRAAGTARPCRASLGSGRNSRDWTPASANDWREPVQRERLPREQRRPQVEVAVGREQHRGPPPAPRGAGSRGRAAGRRASSRLGCPAGYSAYTCRPEDIDRRSSRTTTISRSVARGRSSALPRARARQRRAYRRRRQASRGPPSPETSAWSTAAPSARVASASRAWMRSARSPAPRATSPSPSAASWPTSVAERRDRRLPDVLGPLGGELDEERHRRRAAGVRHAPRGPRAGPPGPRGAPPARGAAGRPRSPSSRAGRPRCARRTSAGPSSRVTTGRG